MEFKAILASLKLCCNESSSDRNQPDLPERTGRRDVIFGVYFNYFRSLTKTIYVYDDNLILDYW